MKSFLEFSKEQAEKKKISLIFGRMQPFTAGHKLLFDKAKYEVVIGLVKGKKTSQDKERNPFSEQLQRTIIMKALEEDPKFESIVTTDSGFIPDLIEKLEKMNYQVKELFCGSDRVKDYKRMIRDNLIKADIKLVKIDRDDEDISATKVRDAIRKNDFKNVKEMMINMTRDLYRQMRKEINENNRKI